MYPIQDGPDIPWAVAEEAYLEYVKRYGREQSIERMAERGGFGRREVGALLRRDPFCMTAETPAGRQRNERHERRYLQVIEDMLTTLRNDLAAALKRAEEAEAKLARAHPIIEAVAQGGPRIWDTFCQGCDIGGVSHCDPCMRVLACDILGWERPTS